MEQDITNKADSNALCRVNIAHYMFTLWHFLLMGCMSDAPHIVSKTTYYIWSICLLNIRFCMYSGAGPKYGIKNTQMNIACGK